MEEHIYLEPEQEIPSIVATLKKTKSDSVGLVVPRGSISLQSAINLKLLKKEAAKLGKEIAIVTSDKIGQHLALQAGLTVYETVKSKQPIEPKREVPERQESAKQEPKEEKLPVPEGVTVKHFQTETIEPEKQYKEPEKTELPQRPRRRRGNILIAIGAVIVILLYLFVLPAATIVIEVIGEPFTQELLLQVATVSGVGERVVGASLEEKTSEVSRNFKTTGQKDVGEKAKGTITLFNAWSSDNQPLAAQSKLVKDGSAFRLVSAVIIPGASVTLVAGTAQTNPGKIDGQIEAENAGEAGNVSAGRFTVTSIESVKQSRIYGESTTKLTGGSSRFINVVSEDDLKQARTTAETELKDKLKQELVEKVPGRIVLDQAVKVDLLEEKASKKSGDEAAEFELKLQGNVRAIVFTQQDFRKAFLTELQTQIGEDREVVFGPDDEITTTVEETDFENGRLTVRGILASQVAPKIDQAGLKQALRFKSLPGSEKIVRDLPQVSNVEIAITPRFGLKRIPLLPTNLKFEIVHK